MSKNKISLVFLLLTSSSIILPSNSNGETVSDLEFYSTVNNCVQQYMSCKNSVAITNPDIDCLQWGKCQHLSTLNALIQEPYIRNTLANNSQLNTNVTNALTKYGKDKLGKQLNTYTSANIMSLITDLVSELNNQDSATLASAGVSISTLSNSNQ